MQMSIKRVISFRAIIFDLLGTLRDLRKVREIKVSEDNFQIACVKWLKLQCPVYWYIIVPTVAKETGEKRRSLNEWGRGQVARI